MTDAQKAIEALDRIKVLIDGYNLNGFHNGRLKDVETIHRALKLAVAVERDLANDLYLLEIKINSLRLTTKDLINAAETKEGACVVTAYNRAIDDAVNIVRIAAAPQSHISALEE